LTVVTADSRRLLTVLTGALAGAEMSIHSARINTWQNGIAVDEFNLVKPPDIHFNTLEIEKKLESIITRLLELEDDGFIDEINKLKKKSIMARTSQSANISRSIKFSNTVSKDFSTIDICCPDRTGLMLLVAGVFSKTGVNVHNAILSTEAEVAIDAFYITDRSGNKIEEPELIEEIKIELEKALIN